MVKRRRVGTFRAWAGLILAPTIWFVHFNAVYAAASIGIVAYGEPGTTARIAILVLTLAALGAVAWCFAAARRLAPGEEDERRFWSQVGRLLAIVSFIGIIYQALPALIN